MVTIPTHSFDSTARALAHIWLDKRTSDDLTRERATALLGGLQPGQDSHRMGALSQAFESLRFVTYSPLDGHDALAISEARLRSVEAIGWPRATRLAEVAWAWARVFTLQGRGQALALMLRQQQEPAASAAREAGAPALERVWPQLSLSLLYGVHGQHNEALACGLSAEAFAAEAGNDYVQSLAAQSLAFLFLSVGDIEGAQAAMARGMAAQQRAGPVKVNLRYNQLLLMVLRSRFQEAAQYLRAWPELVDPDVHAALPGLMALVARVRLSEGRLDEAANLPQGGWLPSSGEPLPMAANRLWLCADVLVGLGRPEEARAQLAQGVQAFADAGVTLQPMNATQLHRALADACEALGDLPAAMTALRQSQAHCYTWLGESMRARLQALHFNAPADPLQRPERRLKVVEHALSQARTAATTEGTLADRNKQLLQVTHELRNPMRGVVWMTSMLMMSDLDERQREYLHLANSSARMALNLCNDVLDLARMDAGKFELKAGPVDVPALVAECAAVFNVPAQAKGVSLSAHCDPALPTPLRGDGLRLQQVLMNLLSNATKFTMRGRIDLDVSWLGGDGAAGAPTVRLSVSDTGPGVPEELMPRLFQEFEQARTATPTLLAGAGLGLALCRQFVRLMGGKIGVDNRPGQGCTFWCLLPLPLA